MIRGQQGIILLSTLLMVTLLTLFVVAQLHFVFLYHRALNAELHAQQDFYQLEAEANQLALRNWSKASACTLEAENLDKVMSLLKKEKACSLSRSNQRYFYLVEKLGIFPCLQTQSQVGTYHVRISLLKAGSSPSLLQLRIARPQPFTSSCESKDTVLVTQSLISWRYLATL